MSAYTQTITYRKDIDVLRAIAVGLVILYHARIPMFSGGFIGVDVFFVISGFLITSIIAHQIDNNKFSFISFYEKRLRRIYPAVIFLIFVVTLFCYFSGVYLDDIKGLRRSARSALLFFSNIYFYYQSGYFDTPAMAQVFLHTWSLSVEMQFYLVYPFLFAFTYKKWRHHYSRIMLALTVLFLALSALMVQLSPSAAFYMLPARAWELTLGGYLAISGLSPAKQENKQRLALFGLSLLLASSVIYNRVFFPSFPGISALWPCLGAACFIAGGTGLTAPGIILRTLVNPATIFTGLISYSLYLWHWPFLVIYRRMTSNAELSLPWLLLILTLVFLFSAFSWKYIETPIRKAFNGPHRTAQYIAAMLIILAMYAGITQVKKPVFLLPQQKIYASYIDDFKRYPSDSLLGKPDEKPKFLLLGDSHAGAFAAAFDDVAAAKNITGRLIDVDGPLLNTFKGRSIDSSAEVQKNLVNRIGEDEYNTVCIILRWSLGIHGYLRHETMTPELKTIGLQYNNGTETATGVDATYKGLRDTLDFLKKSGTQKVYIILPIPECKAKIPLNAAVLSLFYKDENSIAEKLGIPLAEYNTRNKDALEILQKIDSEYDFVELIDTRPMLYGEGDISKVIINGACLYYDDDHLSYTATKLFYPIISKMLEQ